MRTVKLCLLPAAMVSMLLVSVAAASPLLECRDATLADMDAAALREALDAAGGRECRIEPRAWAETVVCVGVTGAAVFGIPVTELRAELTNAGLRRLVAVTRASQPRLQRVAEGKTVAGGLRREIEAREDGSALLRCESVGTALDGEAGGIEGPLPPLPVGAHGWRVCAEPVDGGAQRCVEAGPGRYRVFGLEPGDYRLRATPLGALDERLGAVLARRSDLKAGVREDVLLDHVAVRSGALSRAGELSLIRLPEP